MNFSCFLLSDYMAQRLINLRNHNFTLFIPKHQNFTSKFMPHKTKLHNDMPKRSAIFATKISYFDLIFDLHSFEMEKIF